MHVFEPSRRFGRRLAIAMFILAVVPIGCAAAPDPALVKQEREIQKNIAPTTAGIIDGSIPVITVDVKTYTVAFDKWDAFLAVAPASDQIDASRKTREALAPMKDVVEGKLPLAEINADERSDIHNTLETWDLRLRGAEAPPGG